MLRKFYSFAAAMVLSATFAVSASAWDLKDGLGDSGLGGLLGNIVEGVFTDTNLEVSDMIGVWTVDGSAVTFKSENMLKQAGGMAAAAAIESKIDPYYKQYGLTGAVITINPDSTFTIQVKKLKLNGSISNNDDGTFEFNFKVVGKMSLGSIKTYVQKSGKTLEIMFDATKLKNLVSAVAGISGNSMAKTLGDLLESYDGLCVGFSTTKTGDVSSAGSGKSVKQTNTTSQSSGKTTQSASNGNSTEKESTSESKISKESLQEGASKVTNALKGLFGN